MTIEEVRKVKPDGATHIDDEGEYLRFHDGDWYGLSNKGNWCKVTSFNYDLAKKNNLKPV